MKKLSMRLSIVHSMSLIVLSLFAMTQNGFTQKRGDLKALMKEHIAKIDKQSEKLKMPEFPESKDWFNSTPLRFDRELKGKVVVLDFWTYCCINCIHVLPDLAELERKYAGYPVAFVGVHSAKFENEKVSENIRQAVLRYEIEHPVINDDEMTTWRSIGVRAWPSVAIIGPKGNMLLMVSGEGKKSVIDAAIREALNFYPPEVFRHDPLPIALERDKPGNDPSTNLRFPAKLASDPDTNRLFISDSNNNRIIVTDFEGNFVESIGTGRVGLVDGEFDRAQFYRPQGICFHDNKLYVADAENHALRLIDLEKKTVTTLAGNGVQGRDYIGGKAGAEQFLSTPWDVLKVQDNILIAMAGTHQIWKWDLNDNFAANFSGNGSEQNLNSDNPLEVAWAQPSGLALNGDELLIADSESSAIRGLNIKTKSARAIVGGDSKAPRNLFDFGDVDGVGDDAALQHPLGVFSRLDESGFLVADTYNHKVRILDPDKREIKSFVGTGVAGLKDGSFDEAQFSEPSGFTIGKEPHIVYVADTNNHTVRKLDLKEKRVSTLIFSKIPHALEPFEHAEFDLAGFASSTPDSLELKSPDKKTTDESKIVFKIQLPDKQKWNDLADSIWQIKPAESDSRVFEKVKGVINLQKGTIEIPLISGVSASEIPDFHLEGLIYYCGEKDTTCKIGHIHKSIKWIADGSDAKGLSIQVPVPVDVKEMTGTIHALEDTFGQK